MPGHFSIDAEPETIEAAAGGYTELAGQLQNRSTEVKNVPASINPSQWSGATRDAITTEMTALGDQAALFAPKFTAAAEALRTLATTVRTAKDTTIPSLNRRWDEAQDAYDAAVRQADSKLQQDAAGVPAEVTGTARTATLQGLQSGRDSSVSGAATVRAGTQRGLNGEYDTLITDLQAAFTTAGSALASSTLTAVPDETVAAFVAGGGNGSRSSWNAPDGTPFPPQFGARNLLGKSLPLYDDRRAWEDGVRATELGNKIKDPAHQPTKAELDEFNKLLETNNAEPVFATELMNGLGARGLLELNGRVATLQGDNQAHQSQEGPLWNKDLATTVGAIQKNLGLTLATATQDPGGPNQVSWDWVGELTRLGREKFTVGPTDEFNKNSPEGMQPFEVYGYQLLGPLLRNGTHGADFLGFVGGDLLEFELSQEGAAKDKSGIWENWDAGYGRLDWTSGYGAYAEAGYDPVAALMVGLKNSPEAATQFFASQQLFDGDETGPRLPRVDYLLTDREWPDDRLGSFPDDPNDTAWYDYKPVGFDNLGGALESATRDVTDPRAAQIVGSIVHELSIDEQALGLENGEDRGDRTQNPKTFAEVDLIPPELRDSFGNITARWMPSVQNTLIGTGDGEGPLPFDPDRDLDPYLPGVQNVGAYFDTAELRRFVADLGKDEGAYKTVQNAGALYAGAAYDTLLGRDDRPMGQNLDDTAPVNRGLGALFGALDYGASTAAWTTSSEEDQKQNDLVDGRFAVAGVVLDTAGSVLDKAPVAGAAAQSIFGNVLDSWQESLQRDNTGRVNFETGYRLGDGAQFTEQLVNAAIARNTPEEQWPESLRGKPPSEWDRGDWVDWENSLKNQPDPTGPTYGPVTDASGQYQAGYTETRNSTDPFFKPG